MVFVSVKSCWMDHFSRWTTVRWSSLSMSSPWLRCSWRTRSFSCLACEKSSRRNRVLFGVFSMGKCMKMYHQYSLNVFFFWIVLDERNGFCSDMRDLSGICGRENMNSKPWDYGEDMFFSTKWALWMQHSGGQQRNIGWNPQQMEILAKKTW